MARNVLHRFDFSPGPTSADLIETGLWLGPERVCKYCPYCGSILPAIPTEHRFLVCCNLSAAVDKEFLEKSKCNYILTVDSCPLPRNIQSLSGMKTLFLQITDMPQEDILSHFEESFNFISEGQELGVILVHCYFGMSRSSCIVISYIMKRYGISFSEAYERIKAKRSCVCPNEGFVNQLKLYEKMNFTINRNLIDWRLFRLKIASEFMLKVKILPTDCHDVIKPDPALATVKPDPLVYKCFRCRRVIANKTSIIPHAIGKKVTWTNSQSFTDEDGSVLCTDYLLCEPIAWMNVANSTEGKLHCPKCKSNLGSFNWIMGTRCVCKARMSPCFYFVPSKIELCNIVQNVEATI